MRLVKWRLVCGWKLWLKFYVTWSIVWFFIFVFQTYYSGGRTIDDAPEEMRALQPQFLMGLLFVLFTVAPVMVFSGLNTKQERIGSLTLPSTNLEKYVSSFLVVNIVVIVLTLLGGLTADVLRFVFKALCGDYNTTMVMDFGQLRHAFYMGDRSIGGEQRWVIVAMAAGVVYGSSLYLLGGVLFRRNKWLLSSVVALLLLMGFAVAFTPADGQQIYIRNLHESMPWSMAITAVFVVLAVFNVWASYKLFCRLQVVNNKWINL